MSSHKSGWLSQRERLVRITHQTSKLPSYGETTQLICSENQLTCFYMMATFSVDTGHKLNVHKTFRRRPGRLLKVMCKFDLRPVSRGGVIEWMTLPVSIVKIIKQFFIAYSQFVFNFMYLINLFYHKIHLFALTYENFRRMETLPFHKIFISGN